MDYAKFILPEYFEHLNSMTTGSKCVPSKKKRKWPDACTIIIDKCNSPNIDAVWLNLSYSCMISSSAFYELHYEECN